MSEIVGVGVSPGRAVGQVVRMPDPVEQPGPDSVLPEGADRPAEAARIEAAAHQVRADLEARAARASGEGKEILEATAMMAADPTLVSSAAKKVTDAGLRPERAVWEAAAEVTAMLASLGGYMAERVRDVQDVRDRLVAALTGRPAPGVPERSEPYVLVAHDLAPADTATLDPSLVLALVTQEGGPTSHTAILARSLGIPAVVAAKGATTLTDGTLVLVDGALGRVHPNPSDEEIDKVRSVAARSRTFNGRGATKDEHAVALLANVGDAKGAVAAAEANAEGIGLFRTEFLFLDRDSAPTVEEQVEAYRHVLAAFPGKKVVVRTLDAGADKPLPFLTDVSEPNPALGVRGLRTSWRSPGVLTDQLEAIAQAAKAEVAEVWVMAPMVATVDEARDFVAACGKHGLDMAGVMVEVPSAALRSEHILTVAHFASIGTNDLTQYAMAADRLLGELATLSDPWQPAVLQLIDLTCRGAEVHARPIGVCGEAASDPGLACVLVGLGVSSLSMAPRALPDVADVLATVTRDECAELGRVALAAKTARGAREAVRTMLPVLDELGL